MKEDHDYIKNRSIIIDNIKRPQKNYNQYPHKLAEDFYQRFCRKVPNKIISVGSEVIDAYLTSIDIFKNGSISEFLLFNLSVFFPGENHIISFLVGIFDNANDSNIKIELRFINEIEKMLNH